MYTIVVYLDCVCDLEGMMLIFYWIPIAVMTAIFASDEKNISYLGEQNLEVCSLPWVIGLLTRTDDLGLRAEAH